MQEIFRFLAALGMTGRGAWNDRNGVYRGCTNLMSLKGLFEILDDHPAYQRLLGDIGSGRMVHRMATPEAAGPYLMAALWCHLGVPLLAIVPRPEDARRLHDQLLSYLGEESPVYLFPEPEILPFERLVADAATNNQRMLALAALHQSPRPGASTPGNSESTRVPLVVASTLGALTKTLPPETLEDTWHTLRVGERVNLGDLLSRWVSLGYQREMGVEIPGSFSQRGGIIDIYPPSSPLPARIELWGDEIDSIRLFDPGSQRSVRTVESITVFPASEILPSLADFDRVSRLISRMDSSRCPPAARERFEEEITSIYSGQGVEELSLYNGLLNCGRLTDHLPANGLLVFVRDGEIESEAMKIAHRTDQLRTLREARGDMPTNFPSPQLSWGEFSSSLESRPRLLIEGWTSGGDGLDFQPAPSYYGRQGQLASDVRQMLGEGQRVVVVSRHAQRLSEVFAQEAGIGGAILPGLDFPPDPGSLSMLAGSLREGWSLPLAGGGGLVLLSDSEIFGASKERRPRRRDSGKTGGFSVRANPGGIRGPRGPRRCPLRRDGADGVGGRTEGVPGP